MAGHRRGGGVGAVAAPGCGAHRRRWSQGRGEQDPVIPQEPRKAGIEPAVEVLPGNARIGTGDEANTVPVEEAMGDGDGDVSPGAVGPRFRQLPWEAGSCTCPAGHGRWRRRDGAPAIAYRLEAFRFDAAVCLRPRCVAAKPGRDERCSTRRRLYWQARALQQLWRVPAAPGGGGAPASCASWADLLRRPRWPT